jgi:hypothetical protein
LETLVENQDFDCVNDYFFDLNEYKESFESKTAVDSELNDLGLTFDLNEK